MNVLRNVTDFWQKRMTKEERAATYRQLREAGYSARAARAFRDFTKARLKRVVFPKAPKEVDVSNPFRERLRAFTGRRQPKRDNPYAYGPTGFRPPKKWFDMMLARMKSTYRKYPGQSDESYREALSRLVGGAWARMSDAARMGIVRRYEPMAKNPGADYHSKRNPNARFPGGAELDFGSFSDKITLEQKAAITKWVRNDAEIMRQLGVDPRYYRVADVSQLGFGFVGDEELTPWGTRNPPMVNNPKRNLSVPEQHQLKIAYATLRMSDAMVGVMGSMTKAEAREVIRRLTGREAKDNPKKLTPEQLAHAYDVARQNLGVATRTGDKKKMSYYQTRVEQLYAKLTGAKKNPGVAWHEAQAKKSFTQANRAYSRGDDESGTLYDGRGYAHNESAEKSRKLGIPNPIGRCPIHGFRILAKGKKVKCPAGHWLTVPGRAR